MQDDARARMEVAVSLVSTTVEPSPVAELPAPRRAISASWLAVCCYLMGALAVTARRQPDVEHVVPAARNAAGPGHAAGRPAGKPDDRADAGLAPLAARYSGVNG